MSFARERAAEISDLRYHAFRSRSFRKAPTTSGTDEIRFQLRTLRAVLLDFRDGTIQSISANGSSLAAKIDNGHIELPASALKVGENTVAS